MALAYGRVFSAPALALVLQSGGIVRIRKVPGLCHICSKILDVIHLHELDDDERQEWNGYAHECVLRVQWFAVVGDDTKLFAKGSWDVGLYHRSKGGENRLLGAAKLLAVNAAERQAHGSVAVQHHGLVRVPAARPPRPPRRAGRSIPRRSGGGCERG